MKRLREVVIILTMSAVAVAAVTFQNEEDLYQRGTQALDNRQWDLAVETFGEVGKLAGRRADAALYWKAYAQNKQGRAGEALASLADLRKAFPQSRWVNDAKALEVEVRQASGQPVAPESEPDEELKLIAINSLMQSDSERAIPLLEKILHSGQSPQVKERALFVLAQSGSPKAKELMAQIATGKASRDLQMKALRNLGIFGSKESREVLASVYATSKDVEVKRAILQSFMIAGERERLLAAAKGEAEPELRSEAVRQLGVTGERQALAQLYQTESSPTVKNEILQAMFISGDAEKLTQLARNEKDLELRRAAIRNLGLLGSGRTGDTLLSLYTNERDREIRKEVLQAFFLQGNAKTLVQLARKETDPELKKEAVGKLSLMDSKEGMEYLMEILNK
jgi:HEAT repeat protein